MSYEDLRAELGWRAKSPLARVGLWRLALDEAQLVANSSSVAAAMASSLWRRHAWVVTGTPVSASLDELRGLLEFLGVEPFYSDKAWRTLALTAVGGPAEPLAALLRVVALRRTQAEANLGLPPCTRRDVGVALSTVERAAYDAARARLTVAAATFRGGRRGAASLFRLRALYVALRQTACHPQAGARAAALLGMGGGGGGGPVDPAAAMGAGERLPMAAIMARLVKRAAGEADACLRSLSAARLIEAEREAVRRLGEAAFIRRFFEMIRCTSVPLIG
jgi:E3 ubiquitin-protein ligase SHPRH